MQVASTHSLRGEILGLLAERGLTDGCYAEMLDFTIGIFEAGGLGADYYGYHNVNHELEVTYVTLLAASQELVPLGPEDVAHLYIAALFHDFDPDKSVDKPHEEEVVRFISGDPGVRRMVAAAGADIEVVKALILRTTYPWEGGVRRAAEARIAGCLSGSRADPARVMRMGEYLSVADRVAGYSMGGFSKAVEMAKMNAHALAWRPSVIVRNAVAYFEAILDRDGEMARAVLRALPERMRRNFFGTVLAFMRLREQEVSIQADYAYGNLRLVPTIEGASARSDPAFVDAAREIYLELPRPLQFGASGFDESVRDPDTIVTTLRLNGRDGAVVGVAKGGPLERYELRGEIRDENRGLGNTVFLEPLALKRGYWGLGAGSEMRHMFVMQAHSMRYRYLTSFALREVIERREGSERAEFVAKFDPERWDYYRIEL